MFHCFLKSTQTSSLANVQGVCSGAKGPNLCEDDSFYENFNMDEVDLSIENYDEFFGAALDDPEKLFENDDIDGLFGMEISGADSSCQDAHVLEVICF